MVRTAWRRAALGAAPCVCGGCAVVRGQGVWLGNGLWGGEACSAERAGFGGFGVTPA